MNANWKSADLFARLHADLADLLWYRELSDFQFPLFASSPSLAGGLHTRLLVEGGASAVQSTSAAAGQPPVPAIAFAVNSFLAGRAQPVGFSSLFTVTVSPANPAYLIVSGLDRVEYTAGYQTSAMGSLSGNAGSQDFANFGGDGWSVGVVYAYQAATGLYVNARFGTLGQLIFNTRSNNGDTATITLFGASSLALANAYAANPQILSGNPSLFTDYGSVAVVTEASPAIPPAFATPNGIVSAALGFVGQAWNENGCWVLASDISATAGATLPVTSTSLSGSNLGNGEWFVAYNGLASVNSNWVNDLTPGEMVAFVTTYGGGHIVTVVSGHGANAQLIDNITYIGNDGSLADSANDGSPGDVIVQPPHAAMAEFAGVNPATIMVYELDVPVMTATVNAVWVGQGASVSLAGDFTTRNPLAGQGVTAYQAYRSRAADLLTVSGVSQGGAISASGACTLTSLAGLGLTAAASSGSDLVEIRAFNGSYWGDWVGLSINVVAPTRCNAATALASSSADTGQFAIVDTAANIGGSFSLLQALAARGRLFSVTASDHVPVPVSVPQLGTGRDLLALLPPVSSLQVGSVTVAQSAAVQANPKVAHFSVADTAANISGALAALLSLSNGGKLTAISVSNPSVPVLLSAAQVSGDAPVVALLDRYTQLSVTAATMAAAPALAAQAHVTSVAVSDSAAHIAFGIDSAQALLSANRLGAMTMTDGGTPILNLSAAQFVADRAALARIDNSYALWIGGCTAPAAAGIAATAHVASVSVLDTGANVLANLASLQSLAAANKLGTIALTDATPPALTLKAAIFTADAAALAKVAPAIPFLVAGAMAAQANPLQANPLVASFNIVDSAANITGRTALNADTKLASMSISGTGGADVLTLSGMHAPATINLSGNNATAKGGLSAAKLVFLSPPDALTLGNATASILAGTSGTAGILTIANFQYGLDTLQLSLGSASSVDTFDVSYNGAHAVALTGGALTGGVVLLNQPLTAAGLLAGHLHTAGNIATLS